VVYAFVFQGQKHSKLEKADILEMTVSHLQSVKKSDEQKFMEGFEVKRFFYNYCNLLYFHVLITRTFHQLHSDS